MADELVSVLNLNLGVDGIRICPDTGLSIKKQQGYLVTGPFENANVFLLQVIGGILPPGQGQGRVLFQGSDIYESDEGEIKKIKQKIAFIFSEGTMISNLTVKENLLLPVQYHYPGYDEAAVMEKIGKDFDYFGIAGVLEKRPAEISYYERKKLAFIRASLQEPELILMDKPMFNLEEYDQNQVIRYLEDLKAKGTTFIIVSQCVSLVQSLIDEAILLEEGKTPRMIHKSDEEFAALSHFPFSRSFAKNLETGRKP